MSVEARGHRWRTVLLPHSHTAWPDVRQRLSAELDALLAGREDVVETWRRAVTTADSIHQGSTAALTAAPAATAGMLSSGAQCCQYRKTADPSLPAAWLNAPGGQRQCLAAVANVLRAAISIDTVASPPVDPAAAAAADALLGSSCRTDEAAWPYLHSEEPSPPATCLPLASDLARSLVACRLLGLVSLPRLPSSADGGSCAEGSDNRYHGASRTKSEEEEEATGQKHSTIGRSSSSGSSSCDSFGSMALLRAFCRPHSFAADDAASTSVIVTQHPGRPCLSVAQPVNLDEWCRNGSPLCSVIVTSSGSDSASAVTDAGAMEGVAARSDPADDIYLKLTAASILLPPTAALSTDRGGGGMVVEVKRADAATAQVGGRTSDCHSQPRDLRDIVALCCDDDLRWLTDYEQHICTGSDCYADCHVAWQLMMAYIHVAASSDLQQNVKDCGSRACRKDGSCSTTSQAARDAVREEPPRRTEETTAGAALTAEDAVQLHCAARLRSPALVAPAIVVYESAYDAEDVDGTDGGHVQEETAAAASVLQQPPVQHQQPPPATAAMVGSRRGDLSVSAFADALAASLLGDALASRPPPATRSDSERRPSMPTIVEEALGGSSCCLSAITTGSNRCCLDASSRVADTCGSVVHAAVACSPPSEAKPLCDFAERLAADVLHEALRSTRCGDVLPPSPDDDLLTAADDGAPMQPPPPQSLMARSGSVGSEATACSVCSWQSLDDFSQCVLASAISEAKQEWFGRLAALAGDAFDNDGSYDASGDSICSCDGGDVGSTFAGDGRRCEHDCCGGSKGRKTSSEHARFFHWEFIDRSSGGSDCCRVSGAGRRGSEPARWATAATAAAAAAAALERRGSAPCMLPSKRARMGERAGGDRRPSDYFDDEFLRRLRSGSSNGGAGGGGGGATGDRARRRGSAPSLSGRHSAAAALIAQSNDDYFQAEFAAALRPSSAAEIRRGPAASTSAVGDEPDASLLPAGSQDDLSMSAGYLSLYSDVLVENVMRASHRELAKRLRAAAASLPDAAQCSDVAGAPITCLARSAAGTVQQQRPSAVDDDARCADHAAVNRFAFSLAEQLVGDALDSLRTSSGSLVGRGCDRNLSCRVSLATAAAAGSSAWLAAPSMAPAGSGCDVDDEAVLPPDAEALVLRRRSSGRRESRAAATAGGHQPQYVDDRCSGDARIAAGGVSPQLHLRGRVAAAAATTLTASWECCGGAASSDEPHEQLAALLSWVAASVAGVDELCVHVSQGLLAEKLEAVVRQALAMQLTAGDMVTLVLDYCRAQQQQELRRQAAQSHRPCCSPSLMPFAFVSERM